MQHVSNLYFYLAELGDYDLVQHTPGLISEFRFVEDQTEEMEIDILNTYKTLKYVFFENMLVLLQLKLS